MRRLALLGVVAAVVQRSDPSTEPVRHAIVKRELDAGLNVLGQVKVNTHARSVDGEVEVTVLGVVEEARRVVRVHRVEVEIGIDLEEIVGIAVDVSLRRLEQRDRRADILADECARLGRCLRVDAHSLIASCSNPHSKLLHLHLLRILQVTDALIRAAVWRSSAPGDARMERQPHSVGAEQQMEKRSEESHLCSPQRDFFL